MVKSPLEFFPFHLFEKEDTKIKKSKEVQQEEEKEGMDVIKKLHDNFKRFSSAAGGKILKYKEFWEENKTAVSSFDESGDVYKMWDSEYVVGVLQLPDIALSSDELNAEIDLVDTEREKDGKLDDEEEETDDKKEEKEEIETDDKEETEEKKEEDADSNEWVRPKGYKFLFEKDKEGLDLGFDSKKEKKSKKDSSNLGFDFGDKKEESPELDLDGDSGKDELDFSNDGEVQKFFVVYDMAGDEREEIFRTNNQKVIKSFQDFFENTFKSTIKEQIQNFKSEKETKKAEAQAKAEEELKKQRKSKFEKFMKESFGEEAYERAKTLHPEWNWAEADEIEDEDLEAASNYFDDLKSVDEASHWDIYAQNLKSKYPHRKWEEDHEPEETKESEFEEEDLDENIYNY